jgi:hypothetical protein
VANDIDTAGPERLVQPTNETIAGTTKWSWPGGRLPAWECKVTMPAVVKRRAKVALRRLNGHRSDRARCFQCTKDAISFAVKTGLGLVVDQKRRE